MRVLCAECPTLLDDLLDGLLWTAKSASTTEAGSIRVNYYVRPGPRPPKGPKLPFYPTLRPHPPFPFRLLPPRPLPLLIRAASGVVVVGGWGVLKR